MALENALIAKIVGSITVLGGAGSAGVVYRTEIADAFNNFFTSKEQSDIFLVVKKTKGSDTELTSEKLYEGENNKTRKFQCQSSDDKKLDKECDIFELTPKNAEHKLIGLKEFKEVGDNKKATKEKIASDTFFKLKVKKNVFNLGEKEIKLVSTDSTKKDKKYGTFDVLYKIEGDKVTGETNLIIGKAKEPITTSTSTTQTQCDLEGNNKKQECAIYKFTAQPTSGKDHHDLSFESGQLTTPVTSENFTSGNLYLIDLKTNKLNISELNDKTVIVYENTTVIVKFDFVAPLVSDAASFTASSTTTFFLN